MRLLKILLLVLVLATVAFSAVGALADGNVCDGQIDTNCHRRHYPDGSPYDFCDVYIHNPPVPDLCLIIPEPMP